MTDTLLWSIDETARQLGNVSQRTVKRLLATGKLTPVMIGRRRLMDPARVRVLVGSGALSDNSQGVAVLESSTCQDNEPEKRRDLYAARLAILVGLCREKHGRIDSPKYWNFR